jgi:hypothetical protein
MKVVPRPEPEPEPADPEAEQLPTDGSEIA